MSADQTLRVAIVGGGIGGLTAAVALAREGASVQVLEQAERISRIGAGISFGPNASRLLKDLGLLEALRRVGFDAPAMRFLRWDDGSVLLNTTLGAEAERHFGAPLVRCERTDIIDVLLDAAPRGSVTLGAGAVGVEQNADTAEVVLASGDRIQSDAVIAADGLRSVMRRELTGADDPVDCGTVVYRSIISREQVQKIGVDLWSAQHFWLGPGCHVVAGALSDQTVDYNVSVEREMGATESWTQRADPAEVLGHVDGWTEPVKRLISLGDNVLRSAVFARRPLDQWAFGRVALLGDAAHAMAPFEAQGAVQAVEDAVVLAGCLAGVTAKGVADALLNYQTLRMTRASEIQRASEGRGNILNLPDGPEQRQRDAWLRNLPATQPWGTRQTIWEHDVRVPLVAAQAVGRRAPTPDL
jgi:2-polyprenyl-6-methoxyphenol hydroxylase-like FAD-dependent oxidoreductase